MDSELGLVPLLSVGCEYKTFKDQEQRILSYPCVCKMTPKVYAKR